MTADLAPLPPERFQGPPAVDMQELMVRSPSTSVSGRWRDKHMHMAALTDVVVLYSSGAVATWAAFATSDRLGPRPIDRPLYAVITVTILFVWLLLLRATGAYERRIAGELGEEHRRVARSAVLTFAAASAVATLSTFSLSRAYLALLFGVGYVGLGAVRLVLRGRLRRDRLEGQSTNRVLVIGDAASAVALAESFLAHPHEGQAVVANWTLRSSDPRRVQETELDHIRVFDISSTLDDVLVMTRADTVVVADPGLLGNEGLKSLGWALHGSGIDLLVSPHVLDVAGPRIHVRPVANLPLIHLDEPRYAEAANARKAALDRTLAVLCLLVAAPVLAAIAVTIKVTSPGPVLYRSTRVGIGGATFQMLKFRTMVDHAEQMRSQLAVANDASGPLFKMRADPRTTKVGSILRRYSLDELPQLINVLRGEMSIVGPRPLLPDEALACESGVERRLLVKQGMTGLWQVSGRSDLSWDDTVRLDLDYVENWSMTRDLQIIWRTIGAVLRPTGAY